MNTPLFYIMQCMFVILYMMDMLQWRRVVKSETVCAMPKSGSFRYMSLYVFGVVAAVATGVFVTDHVTKFRLTLIAILMAPVLIVHLRNMIVNASLRRVCDGPDTQKIMKRCFSVNLFSVLIYAVSIPMCMLYLK